MFDFKDLKAAVDGGSFDETPVGLMEFVNSDKYLNMPTIDLSDVQQQLIKASTQIYRRETLHYLYGYEEGERVWTETFNEVIFQLGKGCHAPHTPIYNPETGKWNRLDQASTDGLVVSDDGKAHYATESFKEGTGRMLRVRTALGFEEDVYEGHKYLSYGRAKFYHRYRNIAPAYQEVKELVVGDRIAIGVGFDVAEPESISLEHAELIGYWLGDGMLPTDENPIINMDFNSDELESIARYEELCDFIGDAPTKREHATKHLTYFRHGKNSNAVRLAREFGLWGVRSGTKFIPDAVWKSSNDVLAAVVSKLWQTDGCVYSKNGWTAEYVSVSHQLSVDVQLMLLRLGVPSSIRFRTPKSNFKNASEAGYVTVSSQECINKFFSVVTLLDHKNVSPISKQGRVYARMDGNVYYDRIVSIEDIGEGDYWTRTVPDTGNYIGNGMVSANSGKDFSSTIACAYLVYKLLCLTEPAEYYGKPPHDEIHIINVAINAAQANNVFFTGFKKLINHSPWFQGKYSDSKAGEIAFDKFITVFSGHSEREAFEGYNVIMVILDEISGFAVASTSGNEQAKTAQSIYDMYAGSVTSRFPDLGKLVLLSFPRYKGDFIQQRYDDVIAEKVTVPMCVTVKLDPELPDGVEGNEFDIEWDHDEITKYNTPRVFAIKRTSWESNPTKKIEDYVKAFFDNMTDALCRFACMPPLAVDAFFKDKQKIEDSFMGTNGVDDEGRFVTEFQPDDSKEYYIHVDLARKHDHCAVSMAHVERWEQRQIGGKLTEPAAVVKVDCVRWWTPTAEHNVDFTDVKEYIISLKRRGFDVKLVTFDRWQSDDMIHQLREYGLRSENLSVAKKHYTDMAMVVHEGRLSGPDVELLKNELLRLRIMPNDKIDHPRTGSKDLADATCGAIFNAIAHTRRDSGEEIDVKTYFSISKEVQATEKKMAEPLRDDKVIRPPKRPMPDDLADWLEGMRVLGE